MANYDLNYEGSRVQSILDTGDELRDAGYIFRGEATPSTVPGTPTERVAYIGGPGTYTNFGSSTVVPSGSIGVFKYTGSAWSNQVIDTKVSDGAAYKGIATPTTNPGTPIGSEFYIAVQAGTYTNFGNAVVTAGLNVLKYNGSAWSVDQVIAIDAEPTQGSANLVKSGGVLNSIIQNGPAFDLSAYNAEGGVLATYADLSAALTALNALPADFKKGGMSFKFVLTSDNKYVQYRYMGTEVTGTPNPFLNTANWQGVDDEPAAGSKNLVKSSGVFNAVDNIAPRNVVNALDMTDLHQEDGENGYWNYGYLGKFVKNANYRSTDSYVLVDTTKTYSCWVYNAITNTFTAGILMVVWYDASKNFISGSEAATFTPPSNAIYMRFSWYVTSNGMMVVEGTSQPASYSPFLIEKVLNPEIKIPELDELSSEIDEIDGKVDNLTEEVFDNGLDQNDVYSTNGYWNPYNGNFFENAERRACNKYVPIKGGQTYSGWTFTSSAPTTAVKDAEITACFYDKDKNYISGGTNGEYTAPDNAVYMRNSFYYSTGSKHMVVEGTNAPSVFKPYNVAINLNPNIKVPYLDEEIAELKENTDLSIDIAKGSFDEFAITDKTAENYVGSVKINHLQPSDTKLILAVNHDDFNLTDLGGTRKLYAKYGFAGSFNFILDVFRTVEEKNKRIKECKKLLAAGNEVGLHAYFNTTAWWADKMYDVRPDGTFTFAPMLSELKGTNGDGTGTNSFGDNITASTKFNQIGFWDGGSNAVVASCTDAQYIELIKDYCVYFINYDRSGVDLEDNVVTKGILEWAEYFYNNLIDNTLGYSSDEAVLSDKFAEDYEVPTGASVGDYYPDAAHLLNGKMVFFDDTENPNYNNAEYQKVGRFKKGLFKGAASCCNFEVTDRIIKLAEAFCRYYYGFEHFTNFGRHGSRYVDKWWMNNSIPYDNRDMTVLNNECQKVYRSIKGKFLSNFDILVNSGIKMTNHLSPAEVTAKYNGQVGLYYGQEGIRSPYFNYCGFPYGFTSYLSLLGYTVSATNDFVAYNILSPLVLAQENPIKWAYENVGSVVGYDGDRPLYMTSYLRSILNVIRGTLGTGKIPVLSLDTIANSPNTMYAIEILCQFCYDNDITIVPMGKAREIAITRTRQTGGNLFPNPTFEQTLIKNFGGSSTISEAYIPDGWARQNTNYDSNIGIDVQLITVGNETYKELSLTGTSNSDRIYARVFGIPAGKYKFTANVRSGNSGEMLLFGIGYNKLSANNAATKYRVNANSTYQAVEYEFEIKAPDYDMVQSSVEEKYCLGYGENVAFVQVALMAENGKTTSIYNPKIELI